MGGSKEPKTKTGHLAMLIPRFCVAQALRIMRHSHDQNESFMLSLAETVKSLYKKKHWRFVDLRISILIWLLTSILTNAEI